LCETGTKIDDVTNIIESCGNESTNNPLPPNDNTAVLVITTILRANCDFIDPCPRPDGIVLFSDGERKGTFVPTTHVRGGSQHFIVTMPVGTQYSIAGLGGSAVDFVYEEANIQGDCVGKNSCNSIMQSAGASVTVNFHYKNI
jgi:hypothetical protein